MDENKKTYSVIGTVTIGTDEYRDLLEAKVAAEKDAEKKRSDWYAEYNKRQELEKEVKTLTDQLAKYKAFLASSVEVTTLYCGYLAEHGLEAAV